MAFGFIGLIAYLAALGLILLILYVVIRAAVLSALDDHYKTVRWYEHTGKWLGRRAPRAFDD